ncbi:MAG: transposase [bacterium]
MRKEIFANDEYYHVYNRGVDKCRIFQDEKDYRRFYESLYLFNDSEYSASGGDPMRRMVKLAGQERLADYRIPLVSIVGYCLLPNHFHLFLRQLADEGIPKFLHSLGMGYAKYYNLKKDRVGVLFQGRYRASHIDNEAYYYHVPRYIHLNALDLTDLNWREGQMSNWEEVENYLSAHQWSSHGVYSGLEESLPVVDKEAVKGLFGNSEAYHSYLSEWVGREALPYITPDN